MRRITGRNVYITDLRHAIGGTAPGAFAERCSTARLKVYLGAPCERPEPRQDLREGADLRTAGRLERWHVPFCENLTAATTEASRIVDWAERFELAGVLVDAERTPEYLGQLPSGLLRG
jgi:hypothetical protein